MAGVVGEMAEIEEIFRAAGVVPVEANLTIHPQDQMLSAAIENHGNEQLARVQYYRSGLIQLDVLRQLLGWKFGGFARLGALLDFAGGYGRLTRFLALQLPPQRIWVSDIQAEAVAFQQATFGVRGVVSTSRPEDFVCPQRFDCISVASLFTHLPAATFPRWLGRLYSLLNPGGLLVFSVHDEALLKPGTLMPPTGLLYSPLSEIPTLDAQEYGTTYATEAYVRAAIEQATGRAEYRRIPFGLNYLQDLYLVVNAPGADFSGLSFEYRAAGSIDDCYWSAPEELFLRGWAADLTPGRTIEEIRIAIDGQTKQRFLPFAARPDVARLYKDDSLLRAGWATTVHVPEGRAEAVLFVTATSTSGDERLLYLGPVAAVLSGRSGSAENQTYVARLESEITRKNAAISDLEARLRQREAELVEARRPRWPWERAKHK